MSGRYFVPCFVVHVGIIVRVTLVSTDFDCTMSGEGGGGEGGGEYSDCAAVRKHKGY